MSIGELVNGSFMSRLDLVSLLLMLMITGICWALPSFMESLNEDE